ncbi:MAG: hypothetical protein ACI8ZN_002289, partial [Bacteroidia bacterium]
RHYWIEVGTLFNSSNYEICSARHNLMVLAQKAGVNCIFLPFIRRTNLGLIS